MSRFRHVIELEFPDDESSNVILDKIIEALELSAKEITKKDLQKLKIAEDTGVTLTVRADDREDLPIILERVQELIQEGYTSGYEPTWSIQGGGRMSGETLIIGSLIFNDWAPEKTRLKILEEFATAIEVEVSDLRYDIYSGKWEFQSLNWQSHVEREGIEKFLEQWKGYIKKLNCSLHHLTDPEEINYTERQIPHRDKKLLSKEE